MEITLFIIIKKLSVPEFLFTHVEAGAREVGARRIASLSLSLFHCPPQLVRSELSVSPCPSVPDTNHHSSDSCISGRPTK